VAIFRAVERPQEIGGRGRETLAPISYGIGYLYRGLRNLGD
jgi:hypothetical protein